MARTQSLEKFLSDYVDYLNGIVNRTVTDSRLVLISGASPEIWLVSRFQNGRSLPLDLRPRGCLFFRQLVTREIDPDPNVMDHVIVEEAVYTFSLSEDEDRDWVFRYEYQRRVDGARPHSHLHINAVHPIHPEVNFERVHLPAGRLSVEQILGHLILEHHIEPKGDVGEIIKQLAESHSGFTRRRTDLENPSFP